MFSSGWKFFVVLITLTFYHPSECEGEIYAEKGNVSVTFATKNNRTYMEDRYIRIENHFETGIGVYAIFDGHSGGFSAIFCKQHFISSIGNQLELYKNRGCCKYANGSDGKLNFEQMLEEFIRHAESHLKTTTNYKVHRSGTTCLVVIAEEKRLTVANVGDSRGVMCNLAGSAIDLSVDHKPSSRPERERIERAGGVIYYKSVWRVDGLAMTRSLGDNDKKGNKNVIIATPDIRTFDLDEHQPKFMILASDGLRDVMKSQEAVDFVEERYLDQEDFGVKELVDRAIELKSIDNISVSIVVFEHGHYELRSANA